MTVYLPFARLSDHGAVMESETKTNGMLELSRSRILLAFEATKKALNL